MKEIDRFTLEQQLLDFDRILSDIDIVLKISENEDIDSIQNALIGIKEIYNQRSEDLWNTFEQLVHDKKII